MEGVGRYVDKVPLRHEPLLVLDPYPSPSPNNNVDLFWSVAVRALSRSRGDVHSGNRQLGLGKVSRVQEYVRDEPVPLPPRSLRSVPLGHHELLRLTVAVL
jgi:hypothetical protein